MRTLVLLIIPILLLSSLSVQAQSAYLDTLYARYENAPSPTVKYKEMYRYCYNLTQIDPEKALSLVIQAENDLKEAGLNESDESYLLGLFMEVRANLEQDKGNADASLRHFLAMKEISNKVTDKRKYGLIGTAHFGAGFYFGSQSLFEQSNYELLKAREAYLLAEEFGQAAGTYAQMSFNYIQLEKYDSTIILCNQALQMIDPKKDVGNKFTYNFAKTIAFNELNLPDSTIAILNDSFIAAAKKISPPLYAHLNFTLADAYSAKKMIPQAKASLDRASEILGDTKEGQLYLNYLASSNKYHRSAGNFSEAHEMLLNLKTMEDSINTAVSKEKFVKLQAKFDAQTKDFEISSLKNKNKYKNNILTLGGSLFLAILGSMFFWFKNREEKIKAIQSKNYQQIKIASKYGVDAREIEDDFLKNTTQFIHTNLQNENFTVDALVRHSGMNRNSMNKKLKSLTNKTAVGLIREIRLEKAYSLLLKNGKNVSQVAFDVGFKDPNYFSSCFSDKFGYPPSEILKKSANG